MAVNQVKGNVSIDAENIMPVIKRWLYSDKDIFLREVVSNACDAITKYRMLHQPLRCNFQSIVKLENLLDTLLHSPQHPDRIFSEHHLMKYSQ